MQVAKPALPLSPPRHVRPRFQRLRVIAALMLRGMGTRSSRSVGGYLWAVLEPLGAVLLLAIAFSILLRSPPLGTSFILFYATGVIPFRFYISIGKQVAGAINANRGLLAYPVVNPLDAIFAQVALSSMTDGLVAILIFSGIALFTDAQFNLDLARVLEAFFLAGLCGLGIGTLNCVLFGFFPTWKNVWSMFSRPMFLASGIFFLYSEMPPAFQSILWWNPMIHVTGLMRSGFYSSYEATYVSVPYVLVVAGSLFLVGGWLLRRHASFLIEQ
jgi:capsular polysaccharide transport system permease protein